MNIEKWKKAVIHLECASDSKTYLERRQSDEKHRSMVEDGIMTREEYEENYTLGRDLRYTGTAIFIIKDQK